MHQVRTIKSLYPSIQLCYRQVVSPNRKMFTSSQRSRHVSFELDEDWMYARSSADLVNFFSSSPSKLIFMDSQQQQLMQQQQHSQSNQIE
jgi:hypothetical protein